jgi:hypothetical protein
MNIIEILKKKDINKKYITNYKGKEMIVKIVKCYGGECDIVRVLNDDEKEYRDRGLTEFMYMSEITNLEFKEIVDWSKALVDTKVLVSKDNEVWFKRYFAKYEDGKVYCFRNGSTSFSADGETDILSWEYIKLYQE